ncbi:hypothetical protein MKZ38_008362 [Zalerion maritima]|uniref:Phosphatidylglycerophosphatase GEP4, mitochondrial n=1 Tax=Zalerion maritima TaxID=339359 RepID=A0AAD5RVE3_9PEZI|nr:hypothetical protein MKZ38_008362 [Zalerion maritima]
MNLNLSASLNVFRLLMQPQLCLPHATISTFRELPVPLEQAFKAREDKPAIKAVVLDKDDCFALPDSNEIYGAYEEKFKTLKEAYPGRCLLIVSNTAGAKSWDPNRKLATELEKATGVPVLSHSSKKPGCGEEIMEYFRQHPETGVKGPRDIAVVGDRLMTDMVLANMMGSWGVWVRDGVVPLEGKSMVRMPNRNSKRTKAHRWDEEEQRIKAANNFRISFHVLNDILPLSLLLEALRQEIREVPSNNHTG